MKKSVDPYTGKVLYEFNELKNSELQSKLKQSHECFLNWRNVTFNKRSELMFKAGNELRMNREKYAEVRTSETGGNSAGSCLDLGGGNALKVSEDAQLDSAVETCVKARSQNT